MAGDVESWFKGLPHRILSAVGDLGHLLYSAGADILHGLENGIESMLGGVLSKVTGIAGDISGAFKSVLGIASPSKVFAEHGLNIVQGLVLGINGSSHLASQSASRLLSGVANPSVGTRSLAGAAGGGTVQLEWVGGQADREFMTWLQKNVRIRGGVAKTFLP
jgi:hypothetical protein